MNNQTWELVPPSENKNIVGSRWVFKVKHAADATVETFKARLVAQGYSQSQGVDYLLKVGHLLKKCRSLMKAKLMYKRVNELAPQRLYNIFQLSNSDDGYILRGLFILRHRILKKVSVMVELIYGTEYIILCYIIRH